MKTPLEKYHNDAHYRRLVDILMLQIDEANYTPSELREAVIFACIKYEQTRIHRMHVPMYPDHITRSLDEIHDWIDSSGKALL